MSDKPFPLNRKMSNDASVSDWLGTAAASARTGAISIDNVRNAVFSTGHVNLVDAGLNDLVIAREQLEQALDELNEVITFVRVSERV